MVTTSELNVPESPLPVMEAPTQGKAPEKVAESESPGSTDDTPRNLSPVVKLIPEACYDNPTWLGLAYAARDFAVHILVLAGLFFTDTWWHLVLLWGVSSLSVSALFIIGHDAAHGSLFKSKWLNSWVGHLTMLPSLHAYEGWRFGHNRIHHGHTARQGMDFVWHPLQESDYEKLNALQKMLVRLEWSWLGAGVYYTIEIWWKYMMWLDRKKTAKEILRDRNLVAIVGLLAVALVGWWGYAHYGTALGAIWLPFKLMIMPAALFMWVIGATVYLHHIAPEIRWWPRRQWNKFKGQMEATTIMRLPPGLDFFFHHIHTHVPHHVDMRIPFYRLELAAQAMKKGFPDHVREIPFSLRNYLRITRACKLYDFEKGRWHPYPG
jgi:omega-6 fatty acid desaturase (delta-12 desaturase)